MGLDPSISAFAAASGATDLTPLNNLAKYLRSQSLISSARCFPFKSAQNAGSGSTVYGWGDLTANNCTLVNSPTWGADGIDFDNALSQRWVLGDCLGGGTITAFSRVHISSLAAVNSVGLFAQYAGPSDRSVGIGPAASGKYELRRSSDGGTVQLETFESNSLSVTTDDACITAQWVNGGGRFLWIDNLSQGLTLTGGFTQTSRFNTSVDVGGMVFLRGVQKAVLVIDGVSITDAQREAITDLINAL